MNKCSKDDTLIDSSGEELLLSGGCTDSSQGMLHSHLPHYWSFSLSAYFNDFFIDLVQPFF